MSTATAGLSGNNTLIGTDGSEKIVAGGGDDTIDGGAGSDFINAGGGNDTIVYDEADYKILGGGGIDTLLFKGTNQKLNLAGNVVNGIERLWLEGGGGHQVWFTAADIIRISDTDQMIITGNSSSRIYPGSGWSFAGLTADGGSKVLVNGGAKLIVALPVFVDGFSKNASFTVNGSTALTEDSRPWSSQLLASGQLIVNDINAGQGLLLGGGTQTMSKTGTLTITPDPAGTSGSQNSYLYSYGIVNANDAVQSLGAGKTFTESFTLTTIDGSSMQLDFVITGVNDPAEMGEPTETSVTEDENVIDGNLVASGVLSITDVDTGEAGFSTTVSSAAGNLGALTMAADGRYTYSVSNASVQYLKGGLTTVDRFSIQSLDGTTKTLLFTITGAEDPLVIGDPTVSSVAEDIGVTLGKLIATGTLPLTDVDEGDVPLIEAISSSGNLGVLEIGEKGSYTYSVSNSAVQYLKTGESRTERFNILAYGGIEKTISFTINGADDTANIGNPSASSVTEDLNPIQGNLLAQGTISIIDPDLAEAGFSTNVISVGMTLGTLTLLQSGSYTYSVPNASVQYLDSGQTKIDTFTITSIDGTTKNISFTINGAADEILGTAGNDDPLNGTEGNDRIFGLAGDDNIFALGGDDYIDGGAGNDRMSGGQGNDVYIVDSVLDVVTELLNEGIDRIESSVSYTLPENVENLTLTGTASIDGTGNTMQNIINGNSGSNRLDGQGGQDTVRGEDGDDELFCGINQSGEMYGGKGNDVIEFYSTGNVLRLYGGEGSDTFNLLGATQSSITPVRIMDFTTQNRPGMEPDILILPWAANPSDFISTPQGLNVLLGSTPVLLLVGLTDLDKQFISLGVAQP